MISERVLHEVSGRAAILTWDMDQNNGVPQPLKVNIMGSYYIHKIDHTIPHVPNFTICNGMSIIGLTPVLQDGCFFVEQRSQEIATVLVTILGWEQKGTRSHI